MTSQRSLKEVTKLPSWKLVQRCSVKKVFLAQVFPVDFVKFLRTPFHIEHLWWLLLAIISFLLSIIFLILLQVHSSWEINKNVPLKIARNSQGNSCVGVSFLVKLLVWAPTLFKKRLWCTCFCPLSFAKYLGISFL